MEEQKEVKHEFCNRCKCWRLPEQFLNEKKRRLKNCQVCTGLERNRSKKCIHEGCKTQPHFNYEGETKGLYCNTHKLDDMVNVVNKRCLHEGCKKQPHYNYEGETKGLYCNTHKLDDMIDVTNKRCLHEGCKKQPNYNYEGETKALYCSIHKLDDMVDVISKRCIHEGCKKARGYNYEGETKRLYCNTHKLDDMVDIKNKKCIGQGNLCPVRANPKYDNYCAFCFAYTFPDDPRTPLIQKNIKELKTRDFINENFKGFIHDKALWTGGCDCTHRRRIDHRCLINNTLLCIETDEFQHHHYNKDDEEARLNDLFMIHGGKFIFIRFNPDKYKDKTGKTRNPLLKTRFKVLAEEINKQIQRVLAGDNEDLIEVIYLYYDELVL